ncbi:hypothetical protein Tco_1019510 [Tanacetum coccineum]|uniref:Uncharacterized protein n=1 Tax=Tanacetum coccineum TaxID=301880 RepID=A0ABQ5FXF4_9ASTR
MLNCWTILEAVLQHPSKSLESGGIANLAIIHGEVVIVEVGEMFYLRGCRGCRVKGGEDTHELVLRGLAELALKVVLHPVSQLRVEGDHHEEKVNEKRKINNFTPKLGITPIKEISTNREIKGDDASKP